MSRKEAEQLVYKVMDALDTSGYNTEVYKKKFKAMSEQLSEMYMSNGSTMSESIEQIKALLEAYKKAMHLNDSYDPYRAAYGSMPSCSSANPAIKQLYINGILNG